MTVKELYNWCRACRHKDAEVYLVKDREQVDEDGCLTDLYRLRDVSIQHHYVFNGWESDVEHEALLEVEEERA